MHRFDFPVIRRELLQGAKPHERLIVPDRPKANIRRLQPSEVQRMGAARCRFSSGPGQMDVEEIEHSRVAEDALENSHHTRSCYARTDSAIHRKYAAEPVRMGSAIISGVS